MAEEKAKKEDSAEASAEGAEQSEVSSGAPKAETAEGGEATSEPKGEGAEQSEVSAPKEEKKAPKAKTTKKAEKTTEADTAAVEAEAKPAPRKRKKARKRIVPEGRAYIQASFNNTMITITDPDGQVITWGSAGSSGFKGPKKATPFAAQTAAESVASKAKVFGLERVHVFIKGAGNGREQAIRGLQSGGIKVEAITDTTAIAHNGCRPKKTRRV